VAEVTKFPEFGDAFAIGDRYVVPDTDASRPKTRAHRPALTTQPHELWRCRNQSGVAKRMWLPGGASRDRGEM
jgi:hypothetical protein